MRPSNADVDDRNTIPAIEQVIRRLSGNAGSRGHIDLASITGPAKDQFLQNLFADRPNLQRSGFGLRIGAVLTDTGLGWRSGEPWDYAPSK